MGGSPATPQFEIAAPEFEIAPPTPKLRPEDQAQIDQAIRSVPLSKPDYMQTEHPLTDWFSGNEPTPVSAEAKEDQTNLEQFRKERGQQRQRPSAAELATGLASGAAEMFTAPSSAGVSTEPGGGAQTRRGIKQLSTPGQRGTGVANLADVGLQALTPLMGPAIAENPVSIAKGFVEGGVASKAAGYLSKKAGANPEQQDLAQDLAFWMPGVARSVLDPKANVVSTDKVKGATVGVRGAGAGVAVTPDSVNIGGRVGLFKGSVSIPRNGSAAAAAPALEPPTIEGSQVDPSSQMLADHEVIQQRAARVANGQPPVEPPPAPPAPPKVTEITQDDIQHVAGLISKLPPQLRAQGLLEAHQTMARILEANGKVVGPDGRLILIDSPKAAEKAAADMVNDEVDRQDKAQQESAKAKPAPTEAKAEAPANRKGRRAQQAAIEAKAYEVSEPEPKFEVAAPEKAEVESAGANGNGANQEHAKPGVAGTIESGDAISGGAGVGHTGTNGNAPIQQEGNARTDSEAAGTPSTNQQAVPAGSGQSEKTGFQKGQQVRFSKDFPVRKGQNQEVTETIPQGTSAFIEHAGAHDSGSGFLRLRLADGRKISVNQRMVEAHTQNENGPVSFRGSMWQHKGGQFFKDGKVLDKSDDIADALAALSQKDYFGGKTIEGQIGEPTAKPRTNGQPLEHGFDFRPAEDVGQQARDAVQKDQGALPRGERRKVERTPEEHQTQELFGKARKELGEDATSDQVMARVGELKKGEPEKGSASLANAVYEKLKAGESLGNVTVLNKLAEEHFGSSRTSGEWTPKDAFDAMEAGVNKHLLDRGKDLMAMDAHQGLAELRDLMGRVTSQGTRTEEQIKNQQFSTPPTESYVAAKVAGLKPSDVVLEPSAGNGGLAVWPKSIGAETHVNEISDRRQEMLKEVGFDKPTAHDGELINALLDQKVKPTVVLMNPPFSASTLKSYEAKNRNQYGFNHVDQALQRLQDGGRLVAILGGGQANEPNGGASISGGSSGEWFDKVAKKYNVRANVRVNGKEYQKYGTAFATRLIVIDKDGPTPVSAGKDWRGSVVNKNVDTLEEAYNALKDVAASRPAGEENDTARSSREVATAGHGSPERTGEREAASRSGADQDLSPTSAGIRRGQGAENLGQTQPADRLDRSDRSAGTVRPGETGERVPLHQSGDRSEKSPEAVPAESLRGSGENPNAERSVQLPEVEGLTLGKEKASAAEQEDSSAYVTYKPTLKGPTHPGSIVESKTMATVPLPDITYKPSLPASVIKEGKLSAVQLEAISIAGQQNEIVLPSGERASALIGDGTGVGKGRIGAGVLWDNFSKGRKRLVWVSEKWDLMEDAKRDFNGIGAGEMAKNIKAFQKYNVTDPIDHEGVLFTTYALMRSGDKKGNTRINQLQKWLRGQDEANGAYVLFDESHNLKNAVTGSAQTPPSEIGQTVKKLLEQNPKLRTASLSATAATDVMNLGYLDRLGLWGPGTSFPNGFNEFAAQISGGGISAMEMVARELKAQGKYLSRTLSFKGVTYQELEHKLTADQKELYRTAVKAWGSVVQQAEGTIKETTNGGPRAVARFMSLFYGAQLRFFNVLLTTLKIPTAVEDANKALSDGKSVVITLVNTNEAAQNREKNKERPAAGDDDDPPDYDFGPAEMLTDLVREHYPTQQYKDDVDSEGRQIKVPVVDADGNPVQNPEAVKQRDALLKQVKGDLKLPKNPLDILIDSFGGPSKVAELTGRKERFDESTGKFVKRGDQGVKRDQINLSEMRAFQAGKKRVAILSNAAGTGISLHADNNAANQQKRHHITLQMGWSADKAMQMLGRTHRANQIHPPEYNSIVSDLGGEKRFSATIAKRLGSLGALSKGQKTALSGSEAMDKVNFESDQGKKATNTFYRQLLDNRPIPGTEDDSGKPISGMTILRDLRVLKRDPQTGIETVPDADRTNVTRLLNRLLALDPEVQNAVYDYFYDIFQATVQEAVENGNLDTGVKELPGDEFAVKEQRAISRDPKTGAETFYYPIEAKVKTNRLPPQKVEKGLKSGKEQNARLLRNDKGKLIFAKDAKPIVHADGRTSPASYIVTPANGTLKKVEDYTLHSYTDVADRATEAIEEARKDLERQRNAVEHYRKTINNYPQYKDHYQSSLDDALARVPEAEKTLADAEKASEDPHGAALEEWKKQYEAAPEHDSEEHHLIGGAVLRWWNQIREAANEHLHIYTAVDSKTGKRVVGVEVPENGVRQLLDRISGSKSTVSSGQLSTDVLKNNLNYTLEQNIQVRKGRVGGKPVVQVIPPSDAIAQNLKRLGVIYERGVTPVYYVPTKEEFGGKFIADEKVLNKLLEEYPIKADESEDKESLLGKLHRNESGEMNIGPVVKAAETVHSFLKQEVEDTRRAKDLQWEMYDLDKRHEGRVLRAKQLLEHLQAQGVTQEDRRAIDQHLDALEADSDSVTVPSLTEKQDDILDKVLLPLKEEAEVAFKKVTEGGMTIPNYNPRQTKGKGGMLDRFLTKQGQRWSGRANLLSKQMPATKHRVMMALEDENGERKIVSIKGGQVTAWNDGQPENIGGLSTTDEGRAFEDKDGNIWKLKQATKDEIEQKSNVRYYHDAAASTIVNWLQAKKAEAAHDFLENFKHSDDFENIAMKTGQGNPPKGWRTTNLPQFKGYYFEPHTAEVFDWFFDRLKSGDPDAFGAINSFMRARILLNPLKHPVNIAAHAFIQRGVSGFLPNRMYRLAKTGARAMNAVWNQNQDYLDALDAGAPLQSAHDATRDLVKLFYEQMADAADKGEPWATKAAKAIGFPPTTLVHMLHKLSSKIAWPASDMMFLQAAYEYQDTHAGVSLKDSFREVGRIIPEYRLPVRIMNSTTIGKIMGSKWGTIFGSYHYGELRAFSESMKSAFGAGERKSGQSKAEDVAKGWDRMAMMALGMVLLGGAIRKLLQEVTGDKDAEPAYPGVFGLLHAAERVGRREETPTQAGLKVVTPNPATMGITQLAFNRDFSTGRHIYDPAAKWDVEAEQLMHYLKENTAPMGSEIERAGHTEQGWKKLAWNQLDVNFPKHGAAALAQQIASAKMDTSVMSAEDREKYYARQKAIQGIRNGDDSALDEARAKGLFTSAEARQMHKRARKTEIEDKVHDFTEAELREVYDRAVSDGEQETAEKLARMMRLKRRERLLRHLERFGDNEVPEEHAEASVAQ